MLDTTANTPALLPQQVAATAYERCQVPSGCRDATWHVVATKPRAERLAHTALHHRGYNPYLPTVFGGRPLFPGYCFLQLGLGQPWYPIAWCPGVFQLLITNGKPDICPQDALEALWAGDALRGMPMTPEARYRPGAPCEAVLGGGSKVQAVVRAVVGQKAFVLAIMFGAIREITVSIDALSPRGDT